jgi:hypothetical protein
MELVFQKSTIGVAESAVTSEGIRVTFVHRTKTHVVVYYGKQLIAECRNRQQALEALSAYIQGGK